MTATTGEPDAGAADEPLDDSGGPPARDEGRMSLVEHLRELRSRLIRGLLAVAVGTVVGFVFYNEIIAVLKEPVCDAGVSGVADGECGALVVSGIVGPFALQLKVALVSGLLLASPIWLWQLWGFLAPGLHRRERRWTYVFVGAGAPLFLAGAALSYVLLPLAVRILLDFAPAEVSNLVALDEYLNFLLRMILVFGVAFELPLILIMVNMAGMVSAARIRSWWRGMTFGIFVFSAAATPTGDALTMGALAAPVTLLYGVAIVITTLLDRRKARRERRAKR